MAEVVVLEQSLFFPVCRVRNLSSGHLGCRCYAKSVDLALATVSLVLLTSLGHDASPRR